MKVVLDTNVLVAAFAARGLCEAVLELCLESHEIVLSEPLLLEVQGSLRLKLRLPQPIAEEILDFLRAHSTLVEPEDVPADVCRDPDDLMVLGTAEAAGAGCIVTGDKDLLTLHAFRSIPIWTPRKFWETQVGGGKGGR
jgi:putative PIN family toxin of toxin-antitoxin system